MRRCRENRGKALVLYIQFVIRQRPWSSLSLGLCAAPSDRLARGENALDRENRSGVVIIYQRKWTDDILGIFSCSFRFPSRIGCLTIHQRHEYGLGPSRCE